MSLQEHVRAIISKHQGVRAAGEAVGVYHGYLSRLANGERTDPSDEVLSKLGLRRVVLYEPLPRKRKKINRK